MSEVRARRAIVVFLVLLTLVVFIRAISSAHGETRSESIGRVGPPAVARAAARRAPSLSIGLLETGTVLSGGRTLHRTLEIRGARASPGGLDVDWEARVTGADTARGQERLVARDGLSRVTLSVPLPPVTQPSGVELVVRAREAGMLLAETTFPFTLYPADAGKEILDLFARSRVGLYDPEGAAGASLAALGVRFEGITRIEDLILYGGDLIVVGPGGFGRGRERLGPILSARARSGARILLLAQTTLPPTLHDDLRLWPSFSTNGSAEVLLSAQHPVLRGLDATSDAGYFTAVPAVTRPLLPPRRGNFRVLAEVRVSGGSAGQEGIALLEIPIGSGTVLVSQADLCAAFDHDPTPRILLANALAYLLTGRPEMRRTYLYGSGPGSLPACLRHLSPDAPIAPADLEGVDLLLVPGDWEAVRSTASDGSSRSLAPRARVARFLHEGGTIVLLNPQSLVLDYLSALTGAAVYFEATPEKALDESPLLQGIASQDLGIFGRGGRAELRLRARPGPEGVEPILIAPGLAQYRVGHGTLVALTLPDASECTTSFASSLIARLLTNLGIRLDPGPGIDTAAITLPGEDSTDQDPLR